LASMQSPHRPQAMQQHKAPAFMQSHCIHGIQRPCVVPREGQSWHLYSLRELLELCRALLELWKEKTLDTFRLGRLLTWKMKLKPCRGPHEHEVRDWNS
jgi:hypothetical protein